MIVSYRVGSEDRYRFVWLTRAGKLKISEDIEDNSGTVAIYRISPSWVYLRTPDGLVKYYMKGAKVMRATIEVPNDVSFSDDPILGRAPLFPDPKGCFMEVPSAGGLFTLERYLN